MSALGRSPSLIRKVGWVVLGGVFLCVVRVHYLFLRGVPDPIVFPDSTSYLLPAIRWVFGGVFLPDPSRTIGYPFFLGMIIQAAHSLHAVLIVQHLLVFGIAAMAALMAYRHFRVPLAGAVVVFLLTAALPREVVYAHTILTEVPYVFLFIASLLTYGESLQGKSLRMSVLSAGFIWCAILVRPAGKAALVALLLMSLFLLSFRRDYRRMGAAFLMAALFFGACVMLQNKAARGFWGVDRKGSSAAFGILAPYLEAAHTSDGRIRKVLIPFYAPGQREKLWDTAWVWYGPNGPEAALQKLVATPAEEDKLFFSLVRQAIEDHPFKIALFSVKECFYEVLHFSRRPEHLYPFVYTFRQGMLTYGSTVQQIPQAAELVSFRPQDSAAYFGRIAGLRLYPYQNGDWASRALMPWVFLIGWIPMAALLMGFFLLREPDTRFPVVMILLAIALHLLVTALCAGRDGRYALPLEPLYLVLAAGGIANVGSASRRRSSK